MDSYDEGYMEGAAVGAALWRALQTLMGSPLVVHVAAQADTDDKHTHVIDGRVESELCSQGHLVIKGFGDDDDFTCVDLREILSVTFDSTKAGPPD